MPRRQPQRGRPRQRRLSGRPDREQYRPRSWTDRVGWQPVEVEVEVAIPQCGFAGCTLPAVPNDDEWLAKFCDHHAHRERRYFEGVGSEA